MKKRGRPALNKTIDDLDPALRAQIDEAIVSHANASAADIFRQFGLSQRGLLLDTFTRYAGKVRRQREGEQLASKLLAAPDHLSEPELIQKLRRMVLVDAVLRLQAGDSKLYETMSLLARIQDFDRLAVERAAGEREAEKHEAWKSEYRAKQDEALGQVKTTAQLTPGQVAEIRAKVLGL